MSIWAPDIAGRRGPKYAAIAEAIAEDVAQGRLAPGTRLPPHRDLAWRLGVTVGTVARAYAEAERRGLVSGHVGRGTYVCEPGSAPSPPTIGDYLIPTREHAEVQAGRILDLAVNRPCEVGNAAAVAAALQRVAAAPDAGRLLPYRLEGADERHRRAGAAWLAREGMEAPPERVVVSSGGQQAILAAIAATTRPGETVLTEALTYPGLKSTLALLDRRVEGLPLDDHGLMPEAVEAALAQRRGRVIYTIPTLHNPTAATMPAARRRQLAEIVRRHDGLIIEDAAYAFLAAQAPPPLASLAPEHAIYLSTLSKSVAPAMRTGFMAAPERLLRGLQAAINASSIMPSPLLVEAATLMIEDGSAAALAAAQREEMAARHRLVTRRLGTHAGRHGEVFHVWLALPPPWRADLFVAEAHRRGIALSPAGAFAVGGHEGEHVRISLSGTASQQLLERGLGVLAELLESPQALCATI